jgi:hypothetical protein
MGPSFEAKKAGMQSLAEVSRITSVSPETLNNWYKRKPKLFEVVILGCQEKRKNRGPHEESASREV